MIVLNLLPRDKRKEIEIQKGDRFVAFCYILALSILFITIVFMTINGLLINKINNVVALEVASRVVRDRAETLNQKIIFLSQLQDKYIFYFDSLVDFIKTVPPGIEIVEMAMDKTDGDIKIKGMALSRDDLLQFQKKMEEQERFSDVRFPIENILSRGYVSFEIAAKVNFSKLR